MKVIWSTLYLFLNDNAQIVRDRPLRKDCVGGVYYFPCITATQRFAKTVELRLKGVCPLDWGV